MQMLKFYALLLTLFALAIAPQHQYVSAQSNNAGCEGLPAGESLITITFDGIERQALLFVPESYTPTEALPLVLSFHGFASNPRQQAGFSEWHEYAEELAQAGEQTFITVYPQGLLFPARWNSGSTF